jgi:antitoxin ParD1/3/4
MASNTMSFALTPELRTYIDERVASGNYGNTSEYLRELIRRDQTDQAKEHLCALISEGLESGPPHALTEKRIASLRSRAFSS